jgi:hypothetical protein
MDKTTFGRLFRAIIGFLSGDSTKRGLGELDGSSGVFKKEI